MDRLKIVAIFICLISGIAISSTKNLAKNPDHHHPNFSRNGGGSPQQPFHPNMDGLGCKDGECEAIMDQCNSSFPIPLDHLIQLNETGEFPAMASRDSKCYLNCVMTRLNLFDETGNIDKRLIAKLFGDERDDAAVTAALGKCITEMDKSQDICETIYNKVSCLMKGALEHSADCKTGKM